MTNDDLWTAFEAALRAEFLRHNQDPTWNYEIDRAGMTVRIPHFGGDHSAKLRFKVTKDELRQPAALAAQLYAAALRPD